MIDIADRSLKDASQLTNVTDIVAITLPDAFELRIPFESDSHAVSKYLLNNKLESRLEIVKF